MSPAIKKRLRRARSKEELDGDGDSDDPEDDGEKKEEVTKKKADFLLCFRRTAEMKNKKPETTPAVHASFWSQKRERDDGDGR
ncbi:hypothetical protein S83_064138 [Arachis hypogaea]|uniref:Uncharacterized protein n=1 Tax=Arachis hypogaea TaxID=3818 RepID=A0A444XYB8_ARAHY|nr:uncharacterized protein DS421_18g630910 [Arachis hypogaea]RYQ94649.1 hypothetical protein Ahy_B08g089585 isoform C [Arachis hypogaea]